MSDLISYQTTLDGCEPVDWSTMPPRRPYRIYLGQPNAGAIMPCAAAAVVYASHRRDHICYDPKQFGDIEHNFNMMFCDALNGRDEHRLTHFAMIHSDIGTQPGWLNVLLDEMDRVNADVMTTVIPIKDLRGLTTTGIRYPGVWGTRRFTMREVNRLPETFSIADTDEPDQILAINTGLWVARIPVGGWCDRFPGFTCKHKIVEEQGRRVPWFDSEDWLFSDWLHEQGLRVFATRKAKCFHRGGNDFSNEGTWGMCATEQQRPRRPLNRTIHSPGITIETEKPIAVDSLDHTQPLGAAQDNSVNYAFNRKLFRLIPAESIRTLDLGCAGGGFVRSILEAGGFAIGIDGSDYSLKARRAEWPTIPDHLFTADVTARFTLRNCQPEPVKFNVVTAWEFFEHIAEEDLSTVFRNIQNHMEDGALLIASISASVEPHHKTSEPKDWWIDRMNGTDLYHAPDLEDYFGEDLVRGSHEPGAISQSVIFRCHVRSVVHATAD